MATKVARRAKKLSCHLCCGGDQVVYDVGFVVKRPALAFKSRSLSSQWVSGWGASTRNGFGFSPSARLTRAGNPGDRSSEKRQTYLPGHSTTGIEE